MEALCDGSGIYDRATYKLTRLGEMVQEVIDEGEKPVDLPSLPNWVKISSICATHPLQHLLPVPAAPLVKNGKQMIAEFSRPRNRTLGVHSVAESRRKMVLISPKVNHCSLDRR